MPQREVRTSLQRFVSVPGDLACQVPFLSRTQLHKIVKSLRWHCFIDPYVKAYLRSTVSLARIAG